MTPLVSILIPAYNAARWLGDTLDCCLKQTWPRKEVIVVDDASTDATLAVARKFESQSIKIVSQSKAGGCRARNRAFEECQGDFIQWLDADDLLAPDKIASQMCRAIEERDRSVLYSAAWARIYYRTRSARFKPGDFWRDLRPIDWLLTRFDKPGIMPSHAWLISRYLAECAGPWDERLFRDQDGEYACRLVAASSFVKFVGEARCYYRTTNLHSVSQNASPAAMESLLLSANLAALQLLTLEDSPRTRQVCIRWYRRLLPELLQGYPDLAQRLRERIVKLGGNDDGLLSVSSRSLFQQFSRRPLVIGLRRTVSRTRTRIAMDGDRLLAAIEKGLDRLSSWI